MKGFVVMKKVLSVLLSVLMIFSIAQFGAVTAFADETTETVAEEGTTSNATGPVSGYREFMRLLRPDPRGLLRCVHRHDPHRALRCKAGYKGRAEITKSHLKSSPRAAFLNYSSIIPNSQFPIPNSQFPILNSQFPILNSQFNKRQPNILN